jgi:hypothetical protein
MDINLSQMNPDHILLPYFFNINFNIIQQSTTTFSYWPIPFRLNAQHLSSPCIEICGLLHAPFPADHILQLTTPVLHAEYNSSGSSLVIFLKSPATST